ncbi:MAG: hypothetical protein EXR77_12070 [Myxococcales bacterium]|nr:hypothetical protein [Myxococcales bacterium]
MRNLLVVIAAIGGCAAPPAATFTSTSGPTANFGAGGAQGDGQSGSDAVKADGSAAKDSAVSAEVVDTEQDSLVNNPDGEPTDNGDPLDESAVGEDTAGAGDTGGTDDATVASKPDIAIADGKSDAKTDTGAKDGSGDTGKVPTFGAIWTGVILKYSCNSGYCHSSIWPNQAAAFTNVVSSKGNGKACVGKPVVVAGDPGNSLMWQKIAPGVVQCEGKMPPGPTDGIADQDAQLVYDWIKAGAKP